MKTLIIVPTHHPREADPQLASSNKITLKKMNMRDPSSENYKSLDASIISLFFKIYIQQLQHKNLFVPLSIPNQQMFMPKTIQAF